MYLNYSKKGEILGFYSLEINKIIPKPCLKIDNELWLELLSKTYIIKDIKTLENREYTLKDIDLFKEIVFVPPAETGEIKKKAMNFEKEILELKKEINMLKKLKNGIITFEG